MSGARATPRPPPPGEGDDEPVISVRGDDELELIVSCQSGAWTATLPASDSVVIGRDATSELVIQDESVSRRHAVVHRGNPPLLEDLGSTNGTVVLAKRLTPGKRVPFPIGSVAQIGLATIVLQRQRRPSLNLPVATMRPSAPSDQQPQPVVVDPAMQGLYRVLANIAPTALTVLILGETGTGKEIFAEAIHTRSPRRDGPFLKINCGALPESILESELFGHEKGAFTGALQSKPGLFEAADRGTLFLDEVGELPRSTQVRLLRVLESGEVLRIGSVRPKRVDVRLLSATNRDLNQLVASSEFRMDLLFRINGFTFVLPPLREREAEIAPLARFFAARAASNNGVRTPEFTPGAIEALHRYRWPGNIRELRNVIDRSVALCPLQVSAIDVEHLLLPQQSDSMIMTPRHGIPTAETFDDEPAEYTAVTEPALRDRLQDFERQRIQEALDRCAGHQGKAAKLLGISRRTLFNKLEQYQIQRARKSPPRT